MRIDLKVMVMLVVLMIGLVSIAYMLGRQASDNGSMQDMVKAPAESPAKQGKIAEVVTTPSGDTSKGVTQIDPNQKSTHFRVGNRNVKDIYSDDGIMWVGFSGGVIRYDTESGNYRLFDTKNGLLSNGVFHVSKIDENIVIGTYGGGMSVYESADDKWKNINVPDGLGDAFVYDVLRVDNGDVWVATWSGVNRVRGGALWDSSKWDLFTVENTDGGLPNDWVYGLAKGKDGVIWLATEGGLARFENGEWSNWQHEHGLGAPYEQVKDTIKFKNDPGKYSTHHAQQKVEQGIQGVDIAYNPNYIISLVVDRRDGSVLCGTWGGGLARFDGERWSNYTVAEGLPGNHIFMLYQDPDDHIWIGTGAGLARMEGDGKFKVFTTADGLFSNNVFSMAKATDGSYWVGSYGGVARIVPGTLQ